MDIKTYSKIKSFCIKNLFTQSTRDRHIDDCVQFVAMSYFESGERANWGWLLIEYCRQNGIGRRGKLTAKTIENSLSIDAPGVHEDSDSSYYLLDQESIVKSDSEYQLANIEDIKSGIIEELLSPLNFNIEILKWIKKSFKVKTN